MGIVKKDLERKENENRNTEGSCSRCGNKIPNDELNSNESVMLCSSCKAVELSMEKE